MKTKRVLKIAEVFFRLLFVGIIALMLSLVFVFIHSSIAPQKYEKVMVSDKSFMIINKIDAEKAPQTQAEWETSTKKDFRLPYLLLTSKIQLFLRIFLNLIPALFIIFYLIKFLKSVRNYTTFFGANSLYFKKIGIWLTASFCVFLYYSYFGLTLKMQLPQDNYFVAHSYTNIDLGAMLQYGFFITLALIASFVFKEGESLRNENELTI